VRAALVLLDLCGRPFRLVVLRFERWIEGGHEVVLAPREEEERRPVGILVVHVRVVRPGMDVRERAAPEDPTRGRDVVPLVQPPRLVGTGGESLRGFRRRLSGSAARNARTFGVLKLTLHKRGLDWRFVPKLGKRFTDAGSASCH
jgi:hypothetical protein